MLNLMKFKNRLLSKFRGWFHASANGSKLRYLQETVNLQRISNDYLMSILLASQSAHPNPLLQYGKKYFSQADEDGILEEILRRIGRRSGTCVEIGAGDGLENNTLALVASGWRGVWIDAQSLAFDPMCNSSLLASINCFITQENAAEIVRTGLEKLGKSEFEVLSIDIDGNDGYIAQSLLQDGFKPDVIVIETNEVVPPPIEFCLPYQSEYVWDKSKNSGWSLQSLALLLEPFGYFCVACNLQTGVNAFFVRQEFKESFDDVPRDLKQIYVGRSVHPFKFKDHRTEVNPRLIEGIIRNAKCR